MAISTVTSEALQKKIRDLLPSQQGFGTDLTAQDTIVPIIDLTRAAEGSEVPESLQTALAFGSQTAFNANNATVTIVNTTGFYRIFGNVSIMNSGIAKINMTDGATTKIIWSAGYPTTGGTATISENLDFVVFLGVGESITAEASSANVNIGGSVRQIADINGDLINPVGFTPQ